MARRLREPRADIPPNGLTDVKGGELNWEACITMNGSWGYHAQDKFFKPADMLIRKLVECVSKGGNLLLNVGPDAQGRIPARSLEILSEIGEWMDKYSASIYGCGKAGIAKPDYGRITRNGKKLYFHVFENTVGAIPLTGITHDEVAYVRRLSDGSEAKIEHGWIYDNYPDVVFCGLSDDPVLEDKTDTVIEVTLK